MSITPLPTPPSRAESPSTFSDDADAFVAALPLFVTEVNATAAAFDVTKWISGTTYAIGDRVWSPVNYQTYRRKTNGAGVTDPSSDPTNWATITTILAQNLDASALGGHFINGTLVASVAANALTVAVKTKAGTDPSPTDPVLVIFRSATPATGDYTVLTLTAATSIVVSSGSTLGAINSTGFKVWVVGFNDGGTFRLGVINCVLTATSNPAVYPLAGWGIASSTAEGGAGTADSAHVFYTGTAVASKAYVPLAYLGWESGLGAVGTWGVGPTRAQLYGPGVRLPGERIQAVSLSATGSSTTSTTDVDVTGATISITPTSTTSLVRVQTTQKNDVANVPAINTNMTGSLTNAANTVLAQNSWISSALSGSGGTGFQGGNSFSLFLCPNSVSAQTYKLRQKASGGGGGETIGTSAINMLAEEISA